MMKFGWPISLLAHSVLGVSLLVGFSSISSIEPQEKVMRVHLASIDEITNIKASIKAEKPKPKPVEAPPMTLQTPMENAPEEGNPQTRTVEPEPSPQEAPDADEIAEAVIKEPDPAPPALDLERLSAVVNRTRDQQPEAGQQQALVSEQNFIIYSEVSQGAMGAANALTLSETDALRQKMYECWRIPIDATNAHELVVKVRVQMRRDGTVADARLESPGEIRRSPNPFMQKAAREAVNAVQKCSPYDFLPVEKYASWQDMVLTFIPEVTI